MKNVTVVLAVVAMLALVAVSTPSASAALFEDMFDNNAGGDGGGSGSFAKPWVVESGAYGGAGTEADDYGVQPNPPPSSPNWMFLQANSGDADPVVHIDTGVAVQDSCTYTLSYYTGGRNDSNRYVETLTAELWAGDPTSGGTLIGSGIASNPAADATIFNSHDISTGTGWSGNLFIRFHATVPSSGFQQPLVDSVSLVPEPATMCLLGIGGIGVLIRRKRK